MLLFLLSFLAGILTILAPCVFAVLPIILAGSLQDHESKKRPALIIGSLSVSIILFTFLLKATTQFISIPTNVWGLIAGSIITLVGLSLLFPNAWNRIAFALKLYKSDTLLHKSQQQKSNFGAILTGFALGPVFTSCSPTYLFIVGVILPQNLAIGMLHTVIYTVGLAIPLLAIGYGSQKIAHKLKPLAKPNNPIKKIFACIIILFGILILTGLDKKIETYLLEQGYLGAGSLEQGLLEQIR